MQKLFLRLTASLSALKPVVVLLIATCLFYWKTLFTHQFSLLTGYEGVNQAYAWLNFLVRSIKQGSWPLWDPYNFSGHVFSGEMQAGSFYPLYIPLALFPLNQHGLLSPGLYHVMYAASHFLCAWFMFRLVRELELGDFPGIVAGVCFSFGGLMGRFSDWPHMLNSGIWLPLIFLFLVRALKTPNATRMVVFASICGGILGLSILAGGLHIAMMQAIVIVTAAAFYALRNNTGGEDQKPLLRWRRSGLIIGLAGLSAFAIGAVQLLSSREYSHLAIRFVGIGVPASERIAYKYLSDGLFAHAISSLLIAVPRNGIGQGETIGAYLGVFPLLLAGIGIWQSWNCRCVRYLTGIAIAAFAYSLGSASLLHGVLYVLAPYLWLAREADRFMYLVDFALAVLAAYGAQTLFSSPPPEWMQLSKSLKWVGFAAISALVINALYVQPQLTSFGSMSLALIIASWVLFRHIVSRQAGIGTRFMVLSVILFDLYAFDWSAVSRIEIAAKGTSEMERLLSCKGVAQFLKSREGLFRAEVVGDWVPNIGDAFQVQTTGGSGVTRIWEYLRFSSHKDLFGVRYTIKPAKAAEADAVYQDAAWKIYENPGAYPRAWLVHDAVVEHTLAELLRRWDTPGTDLRRVALLPTPLDAPLDPLPATAGEQARFIRYEANRMELNVHASGRSLLVLSEVYYPGWKATVNDRPARILRVDGTLRGIVVPAGDSRVSLRYRPASIYFGGALTTAGFGGLLLAPVYLWFRRRRSHASSEIL